MWYDIFIIDTFIHVTVIIILICKDYTQFWIIVLAFFLHFFYFCNNFYITRKWSQLCLAFTFISVIGLILYIVNIACVRATPENDFIEEVQKWDCLYNKYSIEYKKSRHLCSSLPPKVRCRRQALSLLFNKKFSAIIWERADRCYRQDR